MRSWEGGEGSIFGIFKMPPDLERLTRALWQFLIASSLKLAKDLVSKISTVAVP